MIETKSGKTNRRILESTLPLEMLPRLLFSPTAWAKLCYLRDLGPTEIGGFAVSTGKNLLRVDEIHLVRQHCGPASVRFLDEAVADFFDAQVDRGLRPEQFARIWVHTHPGESAMPSRTDEETFHRAFGRAEWSVMFILACGGQCYARLRFGVGPGGALEIPVAVDYSLPFSASDFVSWGEEYAANVLAIDWPALRDLPASFSYQREGETAAGAAVVKEKTEIEHTTEWDPYQDGYQGFRGFAWS